MRYSLIRKLDAGRNPELEIRRAARTARVPLHAGAARALSLKAASKATVGVAHRSCGWNRRLVLPCSKFPEGSRSAAGAAGGDPRPRRARRRAAHGAGRAGRSGIRAGAIRRRTWTDELLAELERTLQSRLRRSPGSAPGRTSSGQDRAASCCGPLWRALRQHGESPTWPCCAARVSGSLRLRRRAGPQPGPSERRSTLRTRDVGMLRSFAYAGAPATEGGSAGDRSGPARKAFLEGYESKADGSAAR